ncbi:MAG: lytic transglycosylase domain-containing protein [Deltaproteobacteria bacterium]|nr:lytic transglycosylase domain-containing protein [Deltaproteobacteria bacterium]
MNRVLRLTADLFVIVLLLSGRASSGKGEAGWSGDVGYNNLLRAIEKRCKARGESVDVVIAKDKAIVRRKKGGTDLKPVTVHFDHTKGLPMDLGELNYVIDHWRSVRFEQSMNQVRFFDNRDERIVYGYGDCPWTMDDSSRRRCKENRRKELNQALAKIRNRLKHWTRAIEKGTFLKDLSGDEKNIGEQVITWCNRRGGCNGPGKALKFFSGSERNMAAISGAKERTLDGFLWVRPYLKRMKEIFRFHGVPVDMVFLSSTEANFRPFLRSHSGAVGPWQFLAGSARERGLVVNSRVDERRDILKATQAAARYLAEQHMRLGGWGLAAISFNQGPAGTLEAVINGGTNRVAELIALARAGGGRLGGKRFRVGSHYWPVMVAEIQGFRKLIARLGEKGEKVRNIELVHLPIFGDIRLSKLAKFAGMETSKLFSYNLALGPIEERRRQVFSGLFRGRDLRGVLTSLSASRVMVPGGYFLNLPAEHLEHFLDGYRHEYCFRKNGGKTIKDINRTLRKICEQRNWISIFDLADRSQAAELDGNGLEAVRLLSRLAREQGGSGIGKIAASRFRRLASRLSRAFRFGLDGKPREPLEAASFLADLLLKVNERDLRILDPDGKLLLELARALRDSSDPWRARAVLQDLLDNGKQRWAARALLRDLNPQVLPLRTKALFDMNDVSFTELVQALNPDPGRFQVDVYSIKDLMVCVETGSKVFFEQETRKSATWTAEPWCGTLQDLEKKLVESTGKNGRVSLLKSRDLIYHVPKGADVGLIYAKSPEG